MRKTRKQRRKKGGTSPIKDETGLEDIFLELGEGDFDLDDLFDDNSFNEFGNYRLDKKQFETKNELIDAIQVYMSSDKERAIDRYGQSYLFNDGNKPWDNMNNYIRFCNEYKKIIKDNSLKECLNMHNSTETILTLLY